MLFGAAASSFDGAQPKSTSRLTIRLAANGKPETFDCGKIDCADRLDILARVPKNEPPNRVSIFLRAALSVVGENLSGEGQQQQDGFRLCANFIRAWIEPIPISDAIIPLRGGRPDISSVFAGVKAGTYLIESCPVGKTGEYVCSDVPKREEFQWKADGKEAVRPMWAKSALLEHW